MNRKGGCVNDVSDVGGDVNETSDEREERFAASYLRLCQKQGRSLTADLDARAGDWVVGSAGLRLIAGEDQPNGDEVVVPDLDRVLSMLRREAPGVVVDCQAGDVGVSAFDDWGRPVANVVSRNAPEACMRALLFLLSERRGAELGASTIQLTPRPRE
jgi:hypothetical protein